MDLPLIAAQQAASEKITEELGHSVREAIGHVVTAQNDMANMHGEAMQKLHDTINALQAPKRIVRGPDGRAVGTEVIVQ